jgi:hypothetical protein
LFLFCVVFLSSYPIHAATSSTTSTNISDWILIFFYIL